MVHRWVQVRNDTRDVVLANRAELASDPMKLLLGLIPYDRLEEGQGMVLPWTGSIHTTCLRFSIDVLFLDKGGRVLGYSSRVQPFRIAWAPRGARTAIELPAGLLERLPCEIGDEVTILPSP